MKTIFEEYGGAIITVIAIIALIVVIVAVTKGAGQTQFTDLINNFFQDALSKSGT